MSAIEPERPEEERKATPSRGSEETSDADFDRVRELIRSREQFVIQQLTTAEPKASTSALPRVLIGFSIVTFAASAAYFLTRIPGHTDGKTGSSAEASVDAWQDDNGASDSETAVVAPTKRECPPGSRLLPSGKFHPALQPRVEASVSELCVDTVETTVEAYAQCTKAGVCANRTTAFWTGMRSVDEPIASAQCNGRFTDRLKHPMNCVDQNDAQIFCKWNGARLPESLEWEWIARNGPDGTEFPWGDLVPKQFDTTLLCWANGTGPEQTCEVGSHRLGDSHFGISDLAGNVQEWTSTTAPASRDAGDEAFVIRGSPFNGKDFKVARAGSYSSEFAPVRLPSLGFRCVRSIRDSRDADAGRTPASDP